jgi:hypothetical protein
MLAGDKRSSLLGRVVSDEERKFKNIDTRCSSFERFCIKLCSYISKLVFLQIVISIVKITALNSTN